LTYLGDQSVPSGVSPPHPAANRSELFRAYLANTAGVCVHLYIPSTLGSRFDDPIGDLSSRMSACRDLYCKSSTAFAVRLRPRVLNRPRILDPYQLNVKRETLVASTKRNPKAPDHWASILNFCSFPSLAASQRGIPVCSTTVDPLAVIRVFFSTDPDCARCLPPTRFRIATLLLTLSLALLTFELTS